ncbi:MAG: hypothetical protein JWM82_785, partial [Myxococcales bacterium]|nr:hypothetical protein [Myxococcales bacterium]
MHARHAIFGVTPCFVLLFAGCGGSGTSP